MRSDRIESVGGGARSGVGRDSGGRSGGASNLTNAIQKRSVKVVPADKLSKASKNIKANVKVQEAKAGDTARRDAANVKQSKPAKVVKINSAPKKTGK